MIFMAENPSFKNINKKIKPQKLIEYSREDHNTWKNLYNTQMDNLQDLAHHLVLKCLRELSLPKNTIPQLREVSDKLYKKTGWQVSQVDDLIDSYAFFNLLANRIFPSTVYIRDSDQFSLSRDPDIFHELFGHCPILLDIKHATLFEKFGVLGLQLDETQRQFLQRLFWFTFETGLIDTIYGLKIYGGSLLSSIKESKYAIGDSTANRKRFDIIQIFRTSYRADLLQSIYFVISSFNKIYTILDDIDIIKDNIELAYELGEFPPLFPIEEQYMKYANYNICKFMLDYKEALSVKC